MTPLPPNSPPPGTFAPNATCSPHARLLKYYFIVCLFTGPAFPITMLVFYFRFLTLRYKFDADGVSMNVGILFRREVVLTYRRIQDIHVTRGIIQRWLGLATVACQTASGSSSPELVIEGMMDYEVVRDFLYRQMRGAKEGTSGVVADAGAHAAGGALHAVSAGSSLAASSSPDEALALLTDIRDRIAGLTREIDQLKADGGRSVTQRKEPPHA